MAVSAKMGRLTITDHDGDVVYDGEAMIGLTPITPSLEIARDGSFYAFHKAWGRKFEYSTSGYAVIA